MVNRGNINKIVRSCCLDNCTYSSLLKRLLLAWLCSKRTNKSHTKLTRDSSNVFIPTYYKSHDVLWSSTIVSTRDPNMNDAFDYYLQILRTHQEIGIKFGFMDGVSIFSVRSSAEYSNDYYWKLLGVMNASDR